MVLLILILLTHSSEVLHILITKPAPWTEEPSQYPRIHLHRNVSLSSSCIHHKSLSTKGWLRHDIVLQHAQASTGCTSPKSRMQGQDLTLYSHSRIKV
ncbi:hypothetical protein C8R48DRAFT_251210 [Suillus tomentosus]|nr:hypothetical protein C8R48DRAFT_251210 [Suillus tomentosus]